ncbi:MAG: hypothetical protein V2I33_21305 [Kangiellaceae bacterium]|jgi:hypothetical protein|nr:hypothetical protein [Kangiellaceae bacterium]
MTALLGLGTVDIMLEQLQTVGWHSAIEEIFSGKTEKKDSKSLNKRDLTRIVD